MRPPVGVGTLGRPLVRPLVMSVAVPLVVPLRRLLIPEATGLIMGSRKFDPEVVPDGVAEPVVEAGTLTGTVVGVTSEVRLAEDEEVSPRPAIQDWIQFSEPVVVVAESVFFAPLDLPSALFRLEEVPLVAAPVPAAAEAEVLVDPIPSTIEFTPPTTELTPLAAPPTTSPRRFPELEVVSVAAADLEEVAASLLLLAAWVVESALELESVLVSEAFLLVLVSAAAGVSLLVVTVDEVVVVGAVISRVIVLETRVPSGFSVITTTTSLPD